jgi:predicted Rossmann fold nucleotide-binding protein DprA/Smf involved in DNA uptake
MTNETINAIADALANIGDQLHQISKIMLDSIDDKKKAKPSSEPVKKEVKVPKPITPVSVKKSKKQKTEIKKKLVKKSKEPTVLDRVYKVIKRSRKGATVEKIKEATKLDKKQISNSLYKLTKKGMVKTVSRGVYVAADDS